MVSVNHVDDYRIDGGSNGRFLDARVARSRRVEVRVLDQPDEWKAEVDERPEGHVAVNPPADAVTDMQRLVKRLPLVVLLSSHPCHVRWEPFKNGGYLYCQCPIGAAYNAPPSVVAGASTSCRRCTRSDRRALPGRVHHTDEWCTSRTQASRWGSRRVHRHPLQPRRTAPRPIAAAPSQS